MRCRQFIPALEDHLARHPDQQSAAWPSALRYHAAACRRCHLRIEIGLRSRILLAAARPPQDPPSDPYFYGRLQTRIQAEEVHRSVASFWNLRIASRDLLLASVLFAATLGSFLYNFNRTERPNSDEAIVLDVPHLNPQHPSDDHQQPRPADVMLNLMNP